MFMVVSNPPVCQIFVCTRVKVPMFIIEVEMRWDPFKLKDVCHSVQLCAF